jgi:hypothetical protein
MNNNLEDTLKKRHEKIIYYINEIWKLEREKFIIRGNLEMVRCDIAIGLKINNTRNPMDTDMGMAANLGNARNNEYLEKEKINKIIKKQREMLKEIDSIISI